MVKRVFLVFAALLLLALPFVARADVVPGSDAWYAYMKPVPESVSEPVPENQFPTLIVIILVAVLVVGTVVLIRIFWKSNKTKLGGNGNG